MEASDVRFNKFRRGIAWAVVLAVVSTMAVAPAAQAAKSQSSMGCIGIRSSPPGIAVDSDCRIIGTSSLSSQMSVDAVADGPDVTVTWTADGEGALDEADRFLVLRGTGPDTAHAIGSVDAGGDWRFVDELGVLSGETWYGALALTADGEPITHDGTYVSIQIEV